MQDDIHIIPHIADRTRLRRSEMQTCPMVSDVDTSSACFGFLNHGSACQLHWQQEVDALNKIHQVACQRCVQVKRRGCS